MNNSPEAAANVMADALVAHGHLTRAAADGMLAAQLHGAESSGGAPHAVAPASTSYGSTSHGSTPHGFAPHAPALQQSADAAPPHASTLDASSAHASAASTPPAVRNAYGIPDAPGGFDQPLDHDPQPTPLAQIEIDPLFAPPPTPEGYALELDPGVAMPPQDLAAVRGWFHTMRLPQPIAQSLYSEVERMSRRPPALGEIGRMNQSTLAGLRAAWGERTDTMLGHARRLVDEAAQTHPGIKTALARGPGSNPLVVRQLAEHAARLYGAAPEAQAHPQGATPANHARP